MGYKKTDKCIEKAFDNERLFVLMSRDVTAPRVVIEWIKENIHMQPPAKLHEALDCAIEMERTMGNHRLHADHPDVWEMKHGITQPSPHDHNADMRSERDERLSS